MASIAHHPFWEGDAQGAGYRPRYETYPIYPIPSSPILESELLIRDRYHVIPDERIRQVREALMVILAKATNPYVREQARKIGLLLMGSPVFSGEHVDDTPASH